MTNGKLHVRFRLAPRWMTLDDLELLQVQILSEFCATSYVLEACIPRCHTLTFALTRLSCLLCRFSLYIFLFIVYQAEKLKAALIQYKPGEPSDKQVESTAVHRTPDVNKNDNVSKTAGMSSSKSVRQSSARSTPQLAIAQSMTPHSNEVSVCIFSD